MLIGRAVTQVVSETIGASAIKGFQSSSPAAKVLCVYNANGPVTGYILEGGFSRMSAHDVRVFKNRLPVSKIVPQFVDFHKAPEYTPVAFKSKAIPEGIVKQIADGITKTKKS